MFKPWNHLGHNSSQSLDAQGQRCHIQQQQILDIALQYTTLNSRTHGDSLIRVYTFIRSLVKELMHHGLNLYISSQIIILPLAFWSFHQPESLHQFSLWPLLSP
jgi:NAD-specific glutamate dehydrogenase